MKRELAHIICMIVLWLAWSIWDAPADEKWMMSLEEIAANLAHYRELSQNTIEPSEMPLEALAAGVEYYNSLIRSGRGTVSYFWSRADPRLQIEKSMFTFDGCRMRSDVLEGIEAGRTKIYNGEFQIAITKRYDMRSKEYVTKVAKQDHNSVNRPNPIDPRAWYHVHAKRYLEDPLENRLRSRHTRIVGKESVNERICYVVVANETPTLMWICPEIGFRVVKTCSFSMVPSLNERVASHSYIRYKAYEWEGEKVWFPQRVEYISLPVNEQKEAVKPLPEGGPNILTVYDDFEINPDVSSYFEPRFPPGTLVFDVASRREAPIEQILPGFVEK